MEWLALLAGAGTGIQATAAARSASASRTSLAFQAEVSDQNATLAEIQARDALRRGDMAANEVRAAGAQTLGQQRATMAANGVDLTEGSPLDVLVGTVAGTERDAARVTDNAAREAWAAQVQATNERNKANAARAGMGQFNPSLAFSTSLLTNGTQLAARWYSGTQTGSLYNKDR